MKWLKQRSRERMEAEYDRLVVAGEEPDHDRGCAWRNAYIGHYGGRVPCNCTRRFRT